MHSTCGHHSDSGKKIVFIWFSFEKIIEATRTELADQKTPDSRDKNELHGFKTYTKSRKKAEDNDRWYSNTGGENFYVTWCKQQKIIYTLTKGSIISSPSLWLIPKFKTGIRT